MDAARLSFGLWSIHRKSFVLAFDLQNELATKGTTDQRSKKQTNEVELA